MLSVRAIVVDGPNAYVATDLPRGENLRAIADRRFADARLTPTACAPSASNSRARSKDVHAAGLVHGDLKPSAVFVDGDRVVLADGGGTPSLWTAKHLGERTALIGTPYYAPIEQFGGEAPDAGSDVYNLATLLFEMACGAQPWAGRSFLEVFQAKLAAEPPTIASRAPKARVPRELEAVLRRGLHADAQRRYPSAAALRKALEALD
ncbi:MAG: protein kinase [Planctomycetota bacterium]